MRLVMFFIVLLLFMSCSSKVAITDKKVKRVALVIGNQDYGDNSLLNPINDAIGIKETLERIGFSVTLKKNLTLSQFYQALDEFKEKIEPNNTIVFLYFAGHGNTVKNSKEEHLMMTDKGEKVLVSIHKIYEFLDKTEARHNIVVIDACRDYQNSYTSVDKAKANKYISSARNFRGNFSVGRKIEEKEFVIYDNNCSDKFPRSTIVSYATNFNQMAKDWSIHDENHSPYSRQLIKYLDDEEIPIEEVFRRVRVALMAETNGTQMNTEEISLEKNVWLVPKEGQVAFAPPI
ncbi:hypothetical protein MNB_SV-12-1250 [hydrothermal vent metagenome]|uniref:Caspase family p20 domain-containing protein n=1 Tax=hydrothermal vent metagenome TaxID=652676 RepID=A0A1W1C2B5_9ZZZZ